MNAAYIAGLAADGIGLGTASKLLWRPMYNVLVVVVSVISARQAETAQEEQDHGVPEGKSFGVKEPLIPGTQISVGRTDRDSELLMAAAETQSSSFLNS